MTSEPYPEVNAVSSSNGQKNKMNTTASSSSSNLGSKECNWGRKNSPVTVSGHIWTQCTDLRARRDRHGAEMAAPVLEVANTVSSKSS
jgi:hypothetical protein